MFFLLFKEYSSFVIFTDYNSLFKFNNIIIKEIIIIILPVKISEISNKTNCPKQSQIVTANT